jgi:PAS domain S-box-containing protein
MATPLTVLLLEDRDEDARLLLHALTQAGFEPHGRRVDTEAQFLAALDSSIDVVLSDFQLPGWDMLDALSVLRTRGLDIPFIIVSGAIGEDAAVAAMRHGAVDYLLKDRLGRLGPAVTQALAARRLRQERRQADERLRESEARFRALFDQAAVGVAQVETATLRFRLANQQYCDLLGYTLEELLALDVNAVTHPSDRPTNLDNLRRLVAGEFRSFSMEKRYVHKDGGIIWATLTVSAMWAPGAEPDCHIAVVQDITKRHHAEAALREARERLQVAVSAGNVGLWDWNLRTNRVYFSLEWKRQIGYDDHEIGTGFDEWRSRVHPDDLPRTLAAVQGHLSGATPHYAVEFRFRHKDGSYRHILVRGSRMLDDANEPVRMLGSHVDITEWTQLQAQFLQAQKMDSVGQLAGGIAHDFNNLLTVINGTADLALSSVRPEDPLHEDLRQIRGAGDRAAALTRQLLAFSRKQIMRAEVLDLNEVVSDMHGMLRRLLGETIDLVMKPGSTGCVRVDRSQIEQVVMNLAVNARDAMPDGGVLTMETARVEIDEEYASEHSSAVPGLHVMLAVSDTGAGMDVATRRRVFEPFFTTKGAGQGTGLGLSTVYGIVKQSGGSVRVYSEPGQGATFEVYLPLVEDAAPAGRPVRSATATAQGHETILIVEDEAAVRRLASRVLQSAGYTILAAAGGAEALSMLEQHDGPVDLVLTDVVMPGLSGTDLGLQLMRARPQMKIVYASGYADSAIQHHDLIDTPVHFIAKPYAVENLRRIVREALDAP